MVRSKQLNYLEIKLKAYKVSYLIFQHSQWRKYKMKKDGSHELAAFRCKNLFNHYQNNWINPEVLCYKSWPVRELDY
jgi:hypothetical protein